MIIEETHEHVVEEENYFVSMTDMMVGLIFIFLIMLMYYALQFREVTDQLAGANTTRTEILEQLERTLRAKGVRVSIDTQNGVLRLPDSILFDSGRAELKPEGETAVAGLAQALTDVLPCYTDAAPRPADCPQSPHRIESVYIEGHTDADLIAGSHDLNWDLSVNRATNTYKALVRTGGERLTGLCSTQPASGRCEPVLSVSGYGPQRPAASGDGDDAKRKNRRIDLRLIMLTPDDGRTRSAVEARVNAK